jgi:asparagine synthase (glutamine-hydrolysing)
VCGVVGFWGRPLAEGESVGQKMASRLVSRGPDGSGCWTTPDGALVLAHRRLAVIELSSAGAQPMTSPCGRYVLTYNGEIYNHLDLRRELVHSGWRGSWQGHSDTETLLVAISYWGFRRALEKINGMFAFALWDSSERVLVIARDRLGEKPLYYGRLNSTFLFASELKALKPHPDWRGTVNREALQLYLKYNYVPTPWSIYQGIFKLPPAHFVVIKEEGQSISEPNCYWDLNQFALSDRSKNNQTPEELENKLDTLLRDSVKRRMLSDVSLGAFLSGGFDSATIVSLMQDQSTAPVKTFTIGSEDSRFNEAPQASAIAKHLGTDHTELCVSSLDAATVIPDITNVYDEPFGDSSQIPTYLVSQLAKRSVTVALSGDGGDELFCGYNRYNIGFQAWKKRNLLPRPLKSLSIEILSGRSGIWLDTLQRCLPRRWRLSSLPDRLPKLAAALAQDDPFGFYDTLVSQSSASENLLSTSPSKSKRQLLKLDLTDFREQMMLWDMTTYLPDDILTKLDRASMAVGLESRVPFLDHRLVEFAWTIPIDFKYRNRQGKWLLRNLLYRYVPPSLMDGPKNGFGVPIESWLRGPLREWAEGLLNEKRLMDEQYLNPAAVRQAWQGFLKGDLKNHYHLWGILMFQGWLDSQESDGLPRDSFNY